MEIQQQLEINPFIDQTENQMIVNEYTDCVNDAIEKYGTDDVKQKIQQRESTQPSIQPNEYEFQKPSVQEIEEKKAKYLETCRELFYGQIEELNRCINSVDWAVSIDNP